MFNSHTRKYEGLLYALAGFMACLILFRLTQPDYPQTDEFAGTISQSVRREVNNQLTVRSVPATTAGKTFPSINFLTGKDQKRILITGGAGFIGSHLTDVLMKQGHLVTVVDNLFTGRRKNIEHWMGHPNFEFIRHDIIEPFMIEVDQIYHLACPASPPHYQYNPIKTIKTSTHGTLNMLGLAKRVKARMLFTSTSEVYGDPIEHPQTEEYNGNVNPIGPRACYDEGKRVAETMCYSYMKEENVEVRVARIFNTYGPRMHPEDGRVVSNFVVQALKGHDLTIYGSGKQTRSFQYVSDLVRGLIALMNSDQTLPVNIGNPREMAINQFAIMIQDLVKTGVQIKHLAATQDDPQQRKPNISRAMNTIGWSPQVPVEEGLLKTVRYFREELGLSDKPPTQIWMDMADFPEK